MSIYFDNSSTTAPSADVCRAVADTMKSVYANPSSLHRMGKAAEDLITDSRHRIAKSMCANPDEIIFTSGGTESDNLGIIGYCRANRRKGNRIITTAIEHPAVLEAFKYLEDEGFEAVYVGVDGCGRVDLDALGAELSKGALLVSCMHINNEVGTIEPISHIADMVHRAGAVLHVDAVQSYGKTPVSVKKLGADLLSISAHKVHGPKGVGALYVKKGVRILPTIYGGGQEGGLRSSTENVSGIAGFAVAADEIATNLDKNIANMMAVKTYLADKIKDSFDDISINSPEDSSPSVLNVSFMGVRSEVLLHVLEDKGIYVSSGSACSSHKKGRSHVLTAMGVKDKVIDSAIRFSFCGENTVDEAEEVFSVLAEQIPILRAIMR